MIIVRVVLIAGWSSTMMSILVLMSILFMNNLSMLRWSAMCILCNSILIIVGWNNGMILLVVLMQISSGENGQEQQKACNQLGTPNKEQSYTANIFF